MKYSDAIKDSYIQTRGTKRREWSIPTGIVMKTSEMMTQNMKVSNRMGKRNNSYSSSEEQSSGYKHGLESPRNLDSNPGSITSRHMTLCMLLQKVSKLEFPHL